MKNIQIPISRLQAEMDKLDRQKELLRGEFSEYELSNHLNTYIALKGIDKAKEVLRDLFIEAHLKEENN